MEGEAGGPSRWTTSVSVRGVRGPPLSPHDPSAVYVVRRGPTGQGTKRTGGENE